MGSGLAWFIGFNFVVFCVSVTLAFSSLFRIAEKAESEAARREKAEIRVADLEREIRAIKEHRAE